MGPRRSNANTTSGKYKPTLEEEGIIYDSFLEAEIPSKLLNLCLLVRGVDHIEYEGFAGYRQSNGSSIEPENKAAHDYDKHLMRRARRVFEACNDPNRENDIEDDWIGVLKRTVFYRFDRETEEKASYHHCFVCCRHYPWKSRPRINKHSQRWSGPRNEVTDFELCENAKHVNLPNFDMARNLYYIHDPNKLDDSRKGSLKPDLTVGLCTYRRETYPWYQHELTNDDRVKLFDRTFLSGLLRNSQIPPLYHRASNQATDDTPQFPFIIWEAKKATAPDTHQTAANQTARSVKTTLTWQQNFYEKSEVQERPFVWHFNNIGADWKVYICYTRPSSTTRETTVYVLTELWSGNSANKDQALRLSYILDIIAIWAEHSHKPFIGYCLSRLEAKRADNGFPLDEETLRAVQIEMNRENFPRLFDRCRKRTRSSRRSTNTLLVPENDNVPYPRRHSLQSAREHTGNNLHIPFNEPSQSQRRHSFQRELSLLPEISERDQSRRPPSGSPNRIARPSIAHSASETPRKLPPWSSREYVMPELHDHIWILDADPGKGHLLVIRIDDQGMVLAPLIIFEGAKWNHPQFKNVVRHEKMSHPATAFWTFRFNEYKQHYMWRSIFEDPRLFCNPRVQFCAILPLDVREYRHGLGRSGHEPDLVTEQYKIFKPLETALAIADLVSDINHASERWCLCGAPYNRYSPSMILCDNTKCKLGWYHKRCVDLDEKYETEGDWFCAECRCDPEPKVVVDKSATIKFKESLLEASDSRVHQTKTLIQVWDKHTWPNSDAILSLFDEISCSMDIDRNVASDVPRQGVPQSDKGCWALSKKCPRDLMIVRPANNLDGDMESTVEDLDVMVDHLRLGGRIHE